MASPFILKAKLEAASQETPKIRCRGRKERNKKSTDVPIKEDEECVAEELSAEEMNCPENSQLSCEYPEAVAQKELNGKALRLKRSVDDKCETEDIDDRDENLIQKKVGRKRKKKEVTESDEHFLFDESSQSIPCETPPPSVSGSKFTRVAEMSELDPPSEIKRLDSDNNLMTPSLSSLNDDDINTPSTSGTYTQKRNKSSRSCTPSTSGTEKRSKLMKSSLRSGSDDSINIPSTSGTQKRSKLMKRSRHDDINAPSTSGTPKRSGLMKPSLRSCNDDINTPSTSGTQKHQRSRAGSKLAKKTSSHPASSASTSKLYASCSPSGENMRESDNQAEAGLNRGKSSAGDDSEVCAQKRSEGDEVSIHQDSEGYSPKSLHNTTVSQKLDRGEEAKAVSKQKGRGSAVTSCEEELPTVKTFILHTKRQIDSQVDQDDVQQERVTRRVLKQSERAKKTTVGVSDYIFPQEQVIERGSNGTETVTTLAASYYAFKRSKTKSNAVGLFCGKNLQVRPSEEATGSDSERIAELENQELLPSGDRSVQDSSTESSFKSLQPSSLGAKKKSLFGSENVKDVIEITPPAEFVRHTEDGNVEFSDEIYKAVPRLVEKGVTKIYLIVNAPPQGASDRKEKLAFQADLNSSPLRFVPTTMPQHKGHLERRASHSSSDESEDNASNGISDESNDDKSSSENAKCDKAFFKEILESVIPSDTLAGSSNTTAQSSSRNESSDSDVDGESVPSQAQEAHLSAARSEPDIEMDHENFDHTEIIDAAKMKVKLPQSSAISEGNSLNTSTASHSSASPPSSENATDTTASGSSMQKHVVASSPRKGTSTLTTAAGRGNEAPPTDGTTSSAVSLASGKAPHDVADNRVTSTNSFDAPLHRWTAGDVARWLKFHGLGRFAPDFAEVDGPSMVELVHCFNAGSDIVQQYLRDLGSTLAENMKLSALLRALSNQASLY